MNPSTGHENVPREHKGWRIALGLIIAAALVAEIVFAVVWRVHYYRSKVNVELRAVREAGFPLTLKEWSDYDPVPKGENAADVYLQAFAKFKLPKVANMVSGKVYSDEELEELYKPQNPDLPLVGDGKLPPRGQQMPEKMQTAISDCLQSNAEALDLLYKAAAIPECRFDIDFAKGAGLSMSHLTPFRKGVHLLELQALLRAREDESDGAAKALQTAFAALHSLRNEPVLISQLARMRGDESCLSVLERVLSWTPLTDEQLADLSARIAAEDAPEPLPRAIVGDRCAGEDEFQQYEAAHRGLRFSLYGITGMEAQDHLTYLELTAEAVKIGSGTAKDMRDRGPDLQKRFDQTPKSRILTRLLFRALCNVYAEQLRKFARLRAARTALAVERFRLVNGRLPDSPTELAPKFLDAVPSDPFDDQPIRYRKSAQGFVTYSVGPDLSDDGGKEYDPENSGAPYDITFIAER